LTLHGQSDPGVYSARAFALGGVSATLMGIDAAYFNPAGTTSLTHSAFHGGAGQSFGLSPLAQANAAVAIKTHDDHTLFARISQFGFASYQERQIGIGYAMRLEESFSAALRFDVHQLGIDGYGTAFLPGFILGLQYQVTRTIRIGTFVQNPIEVSTHDAVSLPVRLAAGISYHPSEAASIYLEAEKDIDFPPKMKLATEYLLGQALYLRAGITGNPGGFHAGVGYVIRNNFRIDLGIGYHPQLGFTPVLGLAFIDNSLRS